MTNVTDADREAAQSLMDRWEFGDLHCDDFVEAFARHRQSAILEGMEIIREATKKAIYQLQLKNRAGIDDDNFAAALGHASDEIGNLDHAAILAQHTRTKGET
jgi:hypothetical protein